MTKEEILNIITDVLSEEFEKEKEAFKNDADIKKTLELDSLSIVDLVSILEEEFDIKIDMENSAGTCIVEHNGERPIFGDD